MKTQQEIVARIAEVEDDDFFGWKREVLIGALDFEHAKPWLKDEVTADEWEGNQDEAALLREAQSYLVFAIGKAVNHRGLSASRSIDKLGSWVWLLDDDLYAAFGAEDYRPYGAPQLAVLEAAWGAEHEYVTDSAWQRMREGKPCFDHCGEC